MANARILTIGSLRFCLLSSLVSALFFSFLSIVLVPAVMTRLSGTDSIGLSSLPFFFFLHNYPELSLKYE